MGFTAQQVQTNANVRASILANAIPVKQPVKSGVLSYAAGSPTNFVIQANPVGLVRRFYLEISGTINCAAAHTATPTLFGLKNLISNLQFTDQNSRLRVNTSGIHLHMAASEKRKRPFGAALIASTGFSDDSGFGSNFPVEVSTGAVAGGTPKNFTVVFEIPVVNSNVDLTGAIYANQTTSNNQLSVTLNPNFFAYNSDPFTAGYTTDAALATALPTLTNLTWTLTQDYLDQLPADQNGNVVLPQIDIAFAVCLQMLQPGKQVAGNDNLYALQPFNIYQNIMLFWDNYAYGGAVGGDVDYIKIQVANSYVLAQFDTALLAVLTRNLLGCDMPGAASAVAGAFSGAIYNLDFRHKPLSVNQQSATNIVFRPNTVEAGGNLQYGQEYLWYANAAIAG